MNILIVTFGLRAKLLKSIQQQIKRAIASTNPQNIFVQHAHFYHRCTESKDCQKVVTRHIWQTHVEEADHLRHHQDVKPICKA